MSDAPIDLEAMRKQKIMNDYKEQHEAIVANFQENTTAEKLLSDVGAGLRPALIYMGGSETRPYNSILLRPRNSPTRRPGPRNTVS